MGSTAREGSLSVHVPERAKRSSAATEQRRDRVGGWPRRCFQIEGAPSDVATSLTALRYGRGHLGRRFVLAGGGSLARPPTTAGGRPGLVTRHGRRVRGVPLRPRSPTWSPPLDRRSPPEAWDQDRHTIGRPPRAGGTPCMRGRRAISLPETLGSADNTSGAAYGSTRDPSPRCISRPSGESLQRGHGGSATSARHQEPR